MLQLTTGWRIAQRALLLSVCLGALAPAAAPATEPAAALRAAPNALLSIDQHRNTVIDRIIAEWGDALTKSNAGITIEQMRSMLQAMRADYLLAASVVGSLEGLRNVMASSLTGGAKPVTTKALGDAGDDLVYTPIVPCRIVDTRNGAGGIMLGGQQRNWIAANPGGNFVGQGGAATDCNIPVKPGGVMVNITIFDNGIGPALITAWPFNQTRPNAATLNWVTANDQLANAVALSLCTGGGCTFDFSMFATTQTNMTLDVLGYFAAPVATALQCTQVTSASTPIAVSSDTLVALPNCAAGYARTGSNCAGPANNVSGYLIETSTAGCLYRNLSSVATFNATATSICCRVPGR